MTFQISALPQTEFAPLFSLSEAELAARNIVRQTVMENPGTPCRVSLQDAEVGETVLLLNYEHQPASTPYQASHAIFVREHAADARLVHCIVPEAITSRLVSLRFFDRSHMMIEAEVATGDAVAAAINAAFENPEIAYGHIHNAKPGCFAASVKRVG